MGPTFGCVRLLNQDVNNLISDINDLADQADPLFRVFVGDADYLNNLAGQTDENNYYKYPELRLELGLYKTPEEKDILQQTYRRMLALEMLVRRGEIERERLKPVRAL